MTVPMHMLTCDAICNHGLLDEAADAVCQMLITSASAKLAEAFPNMGHELGTYKKEVCKEVGGLVEQYCACPSTHLLPGVPHPHPPPPVHLP